MDNPDDDSISHRALVHRILRGFKPADIGLPDGFILTSYTSMKGCGCKVPRLALLDLLKSFGHMPAGDMNGEVGIGLDSCVVPLRNGLSLLQTTDFFYPLVDDPYVMGRVTAANVLSDLYATGASECDNILMLLGVANELAERDRDIVVQQFIYGFRDGAALADTSIRGGQTVKCPWLLLGGVATAVCKDNEFIKVDRAVPGDVLVLTKPIGGQVAVNAYEWMLKKNGRVEELDLDKAKLTKAFQQTCEQMCRLNRNAARCARRYEAHACTDITGFGLLGHADNLAKAQKKSVRFIIEKLPIIEYCDEIARRMSAANGFSLFSGTSAETSGGLLVALTPDAVDGFIRDLQSVDGFPVWKIGHVVSCDGRGAQLLRDAVVETVPSSIHPRTPR